ENLQISMLFRMQIQHEVDDCALQSCSQAFVQSKTAACDLGGALKIQNIQGLSQFPMRLGLELKNRHSSPTIYFAVLGLIFSNRDGRMGQVRDGQEKVLETSFNLFDLVFERLDLIR